ncbi:MAG TPA: DUF1152 domain-containing protein [Kofleriaceae bacterium]|nr:DUF1152 domain-containing protein [Kofleriaceae bacterium]
MFDQSVLRSVGQRVLVAGCGGGYDIMGAVPLLHALRAAGRDVHLASLSFCYLNGLTNAQQDAEVPNLYAVRADAATPRAYCPEAHLAKFLDDELGGSHTIWSFDKTGVRPLARAYRALITRLQIDSIILVDGGIDAVLRGDETSLGTPSEDLATLAAATMQDIPVVLACVGMTSELRDGIQHAQVFERFAELTRDGAFLGASSLVPGTPACDLYVKSVEAVFAGQSEQKQSHVHRVITKSLRGEFGATAPHVWLSPLLHLYWFFDALAVARTHCFLDELRATDSIWEVAARIEAARKSLPIKDRTQIPI